jgi:ribosomal protein S18 acetylase RimI-like enzyme
LLDVGVHPGRRAEGVGLAGGVHGHHRYAGPATPRLERAVEVAALVPRITFNEVRARSAASAPTLHLSTFHGQLESLRPEHNWEPLLQTTLDLQLLTPLDWQLLREARLEALRESPHAFTSSHAHEWGWEEAQWQRMFDSASWIIAREAENVIGLARSVGESERPSARHVESIWVAPTHRRRGVLRDLLRALAELERQIGVTDLLLWVLEDNHVAQRAYDALGFKPTGERQFLSTVRKFELRLTCHI